MMQYLCWLYLQVHHLLLQLNQRWKYQYLLHQQYQLLFLLDTDPAPPVSPPRLQPEYVSTVTVLAAVNLPCASTVNVGIALAEPYEPAVTAVSSRLYYVQYLLQLHYQLMIIQYHLLIYQHSFL